MDDLLVGGAPENCELLLSYLNKKFSTNNLGECTSNTLSQEAYVESLTKRFDVQTTCPIPASPGDDLGPKRDDEEGGDSPVREAVGSLL